MPDGVIPDEDAFNRFSKATRHYESTYRDKPLEGKRRVILGGGCPPRNEIWKFVIGGSPTGGSFTFDLNVLGTTEEMAFNWDDTATDVETELLTHTNIASGDVEVTGGPFPDVDITIEFIGDLAKHLMDPPTTIDFSGLTGGTGMIVVFVPIRPGHPKDGSVAP